MLCQREDICSNAPKALLLQNGKEEGENEGAVATIWFTVFCANILYSLDMAERSNYRLTWRCLAHPKPVKGMQSWQQAGGSPAGWMRGTGLQGRKIHYIQDELLHKWELA